MTIEQTFTIELRDPCLETSFSALDLEDMSVYVGESFATQTLHIFDTVSLSEGTMDG